MSEHPIELTDKTGRQYLFIQTHQLGEAIIDELVLREEHERRERERMEDEEDEWLEIPRFLRRGED